ncbi:MAG TPA: MFS transporter [Candidatus Corynebacterium avicola]|uniref:MFS transporter n=1 Tax=Candidatus Corynebacterium avicola TaxID=2838527 RepID=A0A9D1RQJ7_9CORY|nr:MFS transporter [Candidatus Corynebacterium avicola]
MKTPSLTPRATVVLLLASVLPLIDSSLVNVLLPAIGHDLGAAESDVQLGVSVYMLAATAGIVLSTTCLRRFGSRQVWTGAVLVFALASALVGFSGTLPLFVASRALQGAACGFIMPAVQQIAADLVGREGMRSALATIGLPAVIAPAVGPLLGGLLVDAVGWRPLFLVNVPVAALALVLAPGVLPPASRGNRSPLGVGQALPGVLGMVGLLWVVSTIGGSSADVLLPATAVAVLAIAAFCVLDLRSATPLLDMSLYRGASFATVMLLCLIVGGVFYGTLLSTSLHVQSDLGQPAWVAGVLLGAQGLGAWASRSLIKGPWKHMDAFPVIGTGLVVAAVGTVGIDIVGSWSPLAAMVMVASSLVRGLGLGACTLLALSAAYEVVSDRQTPSVGAHTRLMLQLGGALGTALVGVWNSSAAALSVPVAVVSLAGATAALAVHRQQSNRVGA